MEAYDARQMAGTNAPPQPLVADTLQRIDGLLRQAQDTAATLHETRSRLFGAYPSETAGTGAKIAEVRAPADMIADGLMALERTLSDIRYSVDALNNRL